MKDLTIINQLVSDQFTRDLSNSNAVLVLSIGVQDGGKYIICADEKLDPQKLRKIFAQLQIMLNV